MIVKKDIKKKVLIIEDNPLNMKIMETLVTRAGHIPISILDGKIAFKIAQKDDPALILLDIQLIGICGTEIAQKIRSDKMLKKTPIIVVTSFSSNEDKKNISSKTKCDYYVTKPFLPADLIDIINSYI